MFSLEDLKILYSPMANLVRIELPDCILWFSYQTCVAIATKGRRYVIQNYWRNTTGKHLNYIDDGGKASRLNLEEFGKIFESLNLRKDW